MVFFAWWKLWHVKPKIKDNKAKAFGSEWEGNQSPKASNGGLVKSQGRDIGRDKWKMK